MRRALHLGPAGEQVARELLDGYVLNSFFEPSLLLSAHPSALDEARRRMAEHAGRLIHWGPGRDLLARTEALAEELGPSDEMAPDERPVIWLQQTTFEAEDWSYALHSLNGHRGTYHRTAPWMWVLAGPDELLPIAREQASHLMPSVVTRWLPDKPALPPRLAAPDRPVRWLHLSDFHFQGLKKWDQQATLKALLRHAGDLRERDLAPDLVLVTGDVAASGQRKEYEQAERFFTALAETLDLDPADRFFIVPGNHDVDRGAIGPEEHVLRGIETQEEIEKVLTDPQMMGMLSRRLEAFYAFTERFLGPARGWRPERPWRVDVRDVAGVAVGILQLNSAWASGTNDEPGLLVGKAQVQDAIEQTPDAFLRIALVHHPIADLRDVDRKQLETLIGGDEVHFLLRGHLHRSRSAVAETPDGLLVELAAGAVYPGGDYPKTHLLTETDLSAGQGRVHFFRFSDERKGFWAPDTLVYQKTRDGVWTFPLAAHLKIDTEAPASVGELSDARRSTLAARYRAAAAAVHGTPRFVGLASHRPRPNVRVPELFVPLRLKVWGTGEDAPGWTTAELIARLAEPVENGEAARVVVLGGPGSGKTTLCRFAVVCLAGEGPREYAALGQELLPLFLPLRDYVRACNEGEDRSLLDFLVDEARNRLQVPAPRNFFGHALDEGRAVLLLDGFDEVGSAGEREGMRERVQALCRLYPRTPVLLTSRTAGYEDAPV
ncbi:MAG: NACHT domain-containing protein, partial [bacterium]|nr:NACHT domain-containing protein [bacterium]